MRLAFLVTAVLAGPHALEVVPVFSSAVGMLLGAECLRLACIAAAALIRNHKTFVAASLLAHLLIIVSHTVSGRYHGHQNALQS